MSTIFKNNRFFPQNFLLISDSGINTDNQITEICQEAFQLSPGSFNGESLFFKFVLRYFPPYEQDRYRELKRLQEVSGTYIRFKNEYRGYIVVDVSEWSGHFEEELFSSVTLSFLSDMSDSWKYIFVLTGKNDSGSLKHVTDKYMKIKTLSVQEHIKHDYHHAFLDAVNNKYFVHFSSGAVKIFQRFIPETAVMNKETAVLLERDMKDYFGIETTVNDEMIIAYLTDPDSACFEMLEDKERCDILHIIEEGHRI